MRLLPLTVAVVLLAACSRTEPSAAGGAAPAPSETAPAAATASTPAAPAGGAVTPAEMRTAVARDGARATVAAYGAGDGARMRAVEAGVASGDQAWLDAYPLIYPGADGETAPGMVSSLADALTSNAAGSLRAAHAAGPDALASVCDAYALREATPERDAVYARAIAAVEAVNDPALAAGQAACLTALRAGRAAARQ